MEEYTAIILAAGKGTRLNSTIPKPVYPVCGQPMIEWVYSSLKKADLKDIAVIYSDYTKVLKKNLGNNVIYIKQNEQLGTGHALMIAEDYLRDNKNKNTLVLMGDIPTVTAENIMNMMQFHIKENNAITILTSDMDNPEGYGRIIRKENGYVEKITQEVDTDQIENKITEIDAGIYCFKNEKLLPYLNYLEKNNQQKEYYLTDYIEILSRHNHKVNTIKADRPENIMCVNDMKQHAEVEKYLQNYRSDFSF